MLHGAIVLYPRTIHILHILHIQLHGVETNQFGRFFFAGSPLALGGEADKFLTAANKGSGAEV